MIQRKYWSIIFVIISFVAAYFLPGAGESETVRTILTFLGFLFGLIIGFFVSGLWGRLMSVRRNVASEVSGLISYYQYGELLGMTKRHKKWFGKQARLIEKYLKKWISLEWEKYEKADPEFDKIEESIKEIKDLKTNKEVRLYALLLNSLDDISDARMKLTVQGKFKLTNLQWTLIILMASTLLFSLFYLKTAELTSILFTGLISSTILILLIVVKNLSDLTYGEDVISFEPYEKVFDAIGKPRYYPRKQVKAGRIKSK
jgi:hypothetical protein